MFLDVSGSMLGMAPEDWRRAAEVVEARMSETRLDRTALARAAGIDRKTVDNFLDRHMKPRTDKRGGYEAALRWKHGSLLAVARGGEPTPLPEPEVVGPADDPADFVAHPGPGGEPIPTDVGQMLLEEIRQVRAEVAEIKKRLGDGP